MSCCSGTSQATKVRFAMKFRPLPGVEYLLEATLTGQNGSWIGEATGEFDFGTPAEIGCRCYPAYGIQPIDVAVRIQCADGDSPAVQGFMHISFDSKTRRVTIPYTPLNCVNGGPNCSAQWDMIFLNQLGQATLTINNP
jgi:hypothetical protein